MQVTRRDALVSLGAAGGLGVIVGALAHSYSSRIARYAVNVWEVKQEVIPNPSDPKFILNSEVRFNRTLRGTAEEIKVDYSRMVEDRFIPNIRPFYERLEEIAQSIDSNPDYLAAEFDLKPTNYPPHTVELVKRTTFNNADYDITFKFYGAVYKHSRLNTNQLLDVSIEPSGPRKPNTYGWTITNDEEIWKEYSETGEHLIPSRVVIWRTTDEHKISDLNLHGFRNSLIKRVQSQRVNFDGIGNIVRPS